MPTQTVAQFVTPWGNPVTFAIRPDTSDWDTCNAITAVGDEYHLPVGLDGWALDVGAHIGACTVALLVDNPALHVVAIEALPENVELLRENLRLNGVEDRCVVIEGAAGDGSPVRIGYGEVTDPTLIHEYIGNANAPEGSREVIADGVSLRDIDDHQFAWAKIDCEGCEYAFLDSDQLGRIERIEGEVHFGWDRLVAILEPTHVVTGDGRDFGAFTAVRR